MALPPGSPSPVSTERVQAVAKKRGQDSLFSARLDALKRRDQERPRVGPESQMTDAGRAERLNAMNAKQKAELDAEGAKKSAVTAEKAQKAKRKAKVWQTMSKGKPAPEKFQQVPAEKDQRENKPSRGRSKFAGLQEKLRKKGRGR